MYINFNILLKHKLTAQELLTIQAIKQREYDIFKNKETILDKLLQKGFLSQIKGNKKQEPHTKFRLSKKGSNFLRDLQIADITDETKQLASELIELYNNHGIKVTNKKKIVELVSWFMAETNFESVDVTNTISDYLNTTEKEFTSQLQNLIWKGDSVFSTKWNLSQSKLYGLMTNEYATK